MCGIAGIFSYRASAPAVDREELIRLRDAMAARGPDASGAWSSPDGRLGLAHRRLSIIDLSERGAQPMLSEDGTFAIVFNGEIYNHAALRAELETKGTKFRSTSDTEVLLALYAAEGTAMFPRLRGMFAFALWDARQRRLLVARDPYGIKPLHIADDGATLRLASQVKALVAAGVSREKAPAGVAGFYLFGHVPEPHTRYRAIRALPAGSWQAFAADGPQPIVRYHTVAEVLRCARDNPPLSADPASESVRGAIRREVAEGLADSVRHHLVADVAVGAFLSSGVDSCALLALMSESGQTVRTITLAFEELRGGHHDETRFAAAMAERYGAVHSTHWLTRADLVRVRSDVFAAMDQPSVDGFNTWLVSRAAHQEGLKVAVSGLGGDELFGGYPTFRDIPTWVNALRLPSRSPALGRTVEQLWHAAHLERLPVTPKLGSLLRYGGTFAGAYLVRRGLFMPAELSVVMGEQAEEGLRELDPLRLISAALEPDPGDDFARVAALEASLYMRNQLLRDSDWASMAHGLEVRVPFVDVTLLTRLAPWLVAAAGKVRGKELIGAAPKRPLPRDLVERKKSGFYLPMEELVSDPRAGLDGWRRVPQLAQPNCHWARRLAYVLEHDGVV